MEMRGIAMQVYKTEYNKHFSEGRKITKVKCEVLDISYLGEIDSLDSKIEGKFYALNNGVFFKGDSDFRIYISINDINEITLEDETKLIITEKENIIWF
jgi:hypothetical protein